MTFGVAGTLEQLEAKHFDWFAADAGVAAPFVRRRASQLAEAVTDAIGRDLNVPGLDDRESIAAQADVIRERAQRFALKSKDRKSVVLGKSVSVRVDLGGRGIIKKKKKRE